MCVHLKNSAQAPYMIACGSEGTLIWERNRVVITAEPEDKDVQIYGTIAWPKASGSSISDQRASTRRIPAQA